MGNYRFIISGGGTGGHIYPAIAIANGLKERLGNCEFLFVGAEDKMEMEKVPQAGYKIKGLWISGIKRKMSWDNLMFPIKLIKSLLNARSIVKEFKPHLAIGTGGFASGPTLKAAGMLNVPYVLQEQNSYAGITNKWLAKKAKRIFVAYDGMDRFFPASNLQLTGNPVRQDLLEMNVASSEAKSFFELKDSQPTLLVLGGSLGAKRVNELIADKLDFFEGLGLQIIWQCGKLYFDRYKHLQSENIKVKAFLNRMDMAYSAADIIIARAGAGSVSELCLVGKPVIFIPSPNVAEDHQTKNAKALQSKDAALLIMENELEGSFEPVFKSLLEDKDQQAKLARNIKQLARPNATQEIVDGIMEILKANEN